MASMGKGGLPDFKVEDGNGLARNLNNVKMESDVSTGAIDDDIYEDAGDLDFSSSNHAVFLARLPKYLWKTWNALEEDAEIEVGKIRVEGGLDQPQRMSLLLSDIAPNDSVPKEYNMKITNRASSSTFVFTEKDLPGYGQRPRDSMRTAQESSSQPFSRAAPRLGFGDRGRGQGFKVDKNKGAGPKGRRGIPKKTALTGRVQTELNCLPVENESYRLVMQRRAREEEKQKRARETQVLSKAGPDGSVMNSSGLGGASTFSSFIKPTGAHKPKSQDNKALRLPKNELMDKIFQCFDRFKYWPLKSLKHELRQPEAYLKETLEEIAQLVRTGPHAMTWELRDDIPDYQKSMLNGVQGQGQAPDALGFDGASDGSVGDDDLEAKMEDVMPT